MRPPQRIVLIVGSAPAALDCRSWPRDPFTDIVAINNAWRVRSDWDWHIFPEDFPISNRPSPDQIQPHQKPVTAEDYIPSQNAFGGVVYAGGTMAFTAGYWALHALRPRVIAYFGCDMHYPPDGRTHFYGEGSADPLRADVTLRSLEAKSARLMLLAAAAGTACVNLSRGPSRLVFPFARQDQLVQSPPMPFDHDLLETAKQAEADLGYMVPSGRYWTEEARFDPGKIDRIDALWRLASQSASERVA